MNSIKVFLLMAITTTLVFIAIMRFVFLDTSSQIIGLGIFTGLASGTTMVFFYRQRVNSQS